MRVDREQADRLRVTALLLPDLRPGEQQALHPRVSVDHRRLGPSERELIGLEGDAEPPEVADVLTDREGAVDVMFRAQPLRDQSVVLCDEALRALLEGGAIVVGPPVLQLALSVVAAALVVEAVADLMADHAPDPAVVRRRVAPGVEERVLEDRGGEHDLVHERVVVGVDHLRRHEPLVAVDGLADLADRAVMLEDRRPAHVADEVVRLDRDGGVVTPGLGVADLGRERVELGERALPRLLPHPLQGRDALPVGLEQILDQLVHRRLGRRREVPLDVDLAHRVPERPLDQRNAAFPALAERRHAAELGAVEG
ncbi:hypothetical protein ABE10_01500, partial [Bacillus toyonensis]|nr:hypothetical protein [Bacillus toyonensis]